MPNYDGPHYAPYDDVLMGKLTKRQWQQVFTIVRQKQKSLLEMFDEEHYNELNDILDNSTHWLTMPKSMTHNQMHGPLNDIHYSTNH